MPQPKSGSMTRSPGLVDSKINRLSCTSSSSDTVRNPSRLANAGGKLQPVPRKDDFPAMALPSAAYHDRGQAQDDAAAVGAGVAHARRGLLAYQDGGRPLDDGIRRADASAVVGHYS